MSSNPRAQEVARFVGARMRQRRIELGLSQQGLATLLNVTYQQIHKYETGASSPVSERLFALASALDVEIGYFLRRLGPWRLSASPRTAGRARPRPGVSGRSPAPSRKDALLLLARILSETGPEGNPLAI